mmetsp:Transcript_6170/g.7771  ORF Transcript_6170/g.7771 Transcript_6170/m.7771 type:complete len:89 (-) Transcript_6170:510-776(-)
MNIFPLISIFEDHMAYFSSLPQDELNSAPGSMMGCTWHTKFDQIDHLLDGDIDPVNFDLYGQDGYLDMLKDNTGLRGAMKLRFMKRRV